MRFSVLLFLLAGCASAQTVPLMEARPLPPPTGPVLTVRVQTDGSALVNGATADSAAVVEAVREHIRSHPDGATAFSSSRDALYADYIRVLDAIKAAYVAERDVYSLREYGARYSELDDPEQGAVREAVPLRITLAEPD